MVLLQAKPVPDQWDLFESAYNSDYAKWNGFLMRNPVVKSIVEIRAASVCSSWRTTGTNAKTLAKRLDNMRGRGNETFKLIMANMYKVAYICGDAYAELIYDGDKAVDLEILPSDNIRQVIQKGKIIRFEEVNGNAKWNPKKIFHLTYNRRGAMTHGIGQIEAMNNILIDYEQMVQQGSEIFRLFTKPMQIILANTDRKDKLTDLETQFKDAQETFSKTIILPKGLVDKFDAVQLSIPLQPGDWMKVLREEIFMATQTPEIILGTGYSTSEEDAKTRIGGFRQSIRYDQKWLEESLRQQFFSQIYPEGMTDIAFSFATEAQDERFNRLIDAGTSINGWEISPENKAALFADILAEAGLIEE